MKKIIIKKWVLFSTMLVSMFLFSYHLSVLVFDGYPLDRTAQLSLLLSLVSTFLIALGVFLQWRKTI